MSKEIKYITYYRQFNNELNDVYINIGGNYFKIEKISHIGQLFTHWESYTTDSKARGETKKEFSIVVDGKEYIIVVFKDYANKIHKKIIDKAFPKVTKEEKVII